VVVVTPVKLELHIDCGVEVLYYCTTVLVACAWAGQKSPPGPTRRQPYNGYG
jgi:hypothetical protein